MNLANPELAVKGMSAVEWTALAAMAPLLQCAFLPNTDDMVTAMIIFTLVFAAKAFFALHTPTDSSEKIVEGNC